MNKVSKVDFQGPHHSKEIIYLDNDYRQTNNSENFAKNQCKLTKTFIYFLCGGIYNSEVKGKEEHDYI